MHIHKSDDEVMKMFGDPSLSLRLMKIGHDVEYASGQQPNNFLACSFWEAFQDKKPVRQILQFVLDCYNDNPRAVIGIVGEDCINELKKLIPNGEDKS